MRKRERERERERDTHVGFCLPLSGMRERERGRERGREGGDVATKQLQQISILSSYLTLNIFSSQEVGLVGVNAGCHDNGAR